YVRGTVDSAANQVQPTGVAGGVAVGKDNLVYFATGIGYMCATEWRKGRADYRWKVRALEHLEGTGRNNANLDPTSEGYLDDYAFTATPVAGDRVIFASRGRGS